MSDESEHLEAVLCSLGQSVALPCRLASPVTPVLVHKSAQWKVWLHSRLK